MIYKDIKKIKPKDYSLCEIITNYNNYYIATYYTIWETFLKYDVNEDELDLELGHIQTREHPEIVEFWKYNTTKIY